MFLDKVTITIKAGNGGSGHISFYRDALSMTGPPDGGDGGRGGNIIFVGSKREDNLIGFRYTKKFQAEDGTNGGRNNRAGANGKPLVIPVPLGTRIYKVENKGNEDYKSSIICDITEEGQEFIALRGGSGGRGNAFFATGKKRTPNFSQTGVITKTYNVNLELNSIADVGLVGFPNVGKSTLLSAISRANPKIANYPFTTLHPNIAVTNILDKNLIVADIPGLIEGASDGIGLGYDFLRHVTRTRLLIHVIDISESEGRTAIEDFNTINRELANFSPDLATKHQVIALNKIDIATPEQINRFKKCIEQKQPPFVKGVTEGRVFSLFPISAATGEGTKELLKHVASIISTMPKPEPINITGQLEETIDKNSFIVTAQNGHYHVTGPLVDNLIRGVVLTDTESNYYFQRRLIESGIIDELKRAGMTEGNTVHIADIEFEYME